MHGIGHSIGAHVMGQIYNFGGVKLDRISGLDPAGPCFEDSSSDIHIKDTDKKRYWGINREAAYLGKNFYF